MKRYTGDAVLNGSLNVRSNKPLDDRLVVNEKVDLYSLDINTAYLGMPVTCIIDKCIYILTDIENIDNEEGWTRAGSGGGDDPHGYDGPKIVILSISEYEELDPKDPDTLYFLVANSLTDWSLGGNLPIVLGEPRIEEGTKLGDSLPITLSSDSPSL